MLEFLPILNTCTIERTRCDDEGWGEWLQGTANFPVSFQDRQGRAKLYTTRSNWAWGFHGREQQEPSRGLSVL